LENNHLTLHAMPLIEVRFPWQAVSPMSSRSLTRQNINTTSSASATQDNTRHHHFQLANKQKNGIPFSNLTIHSSSTAHLRQKN